MYKCYVNVLFLLGTAANNRCCIFLFAESSFEDNRCPNSIPQGTYQTVYNLQDHDDPQCVGQLTSETVVTDKTMRINSCMTGSATYGE